MSEQAQRIPLDGAIRLTMEISGAHLTVNWREDIDEIQTTGAEFTVDRAGDEIFLRAERRGRGGGLFDLLPNISTPGVKIDWGGPGNSIEVSDDDGVIVRTGLGRQSGSAEASSITLDVPASLTATSLEVESGDLTLQSPTHKVEASLKKGSLRSSGGDGELTAALGSGTSRIRDLTGSLSVMGGSGNVEINDCQAVTQVRAGSGRITLENVRGDSIDLIAGSGDVTLRSCEARELSCQSGSGDVEIAGGEADRITVRSGSGQIACSAVFGPEPQSFTTGSGSISVGVPQGLPARFDVSTQGGEIDSDMQLVSVGQRGPRSRRTRRRVGTVGAGEPRADVSVRASSGDISLYWLRATSDASGSVIAVPPPDSSAAETTDATTQPETTGGESTPDDGPVSRESDERESILESLARGEISVDEADDLLQVLERQGRESI